MKTLFNAPPTSPLAEIDVEDLGNFFVQLTREDFLQVRASDGPNVHDTMAYSLSNEIISTPDSFYTKSLIKILLSLQLTTNDYVKLKELKKLQEEMMEVVSDKLCLKNIDKFGATLAEWIKADPNQNEPEKEEAAAAAEEEGATDKPENASEEPEAADSENTLNATKANKRRILFNHNNTTMLTPRQAGESNEPCSSISSGNSVFLSPKPPTPKAKRFKSNVVTKIDDTSSEDEDDEELVSGNLSRHGKKGLMKKNRLDSGECP